MASTMRSADDGVWCMGSSNGAHRGRRTARVRTADLPIFDTGLAQGCLQSLLAKPMPRRMGAMSQSLSEEIHVICTTIHGRTHAQTGAQHPSALGHCRGAGDFGRVLWLELWLGLGR